jgi:hypothetical protein
MHLGAALPGKIQASECQSRSFKGASPSSWWQLNKEITSVLGERPESGLKQMGLASDSLHMVTGGSPKLQIEMGGCRACTSVGLSQALAIVGKNHLHDFSRLPRFSLRGSEARTGASSWGP